MQINYKHTTFILLVVIASLLVTIGALAENPSRPLAAPDDATKGNALDFDGVDDYVALNGSFGGVGNVTIEAWIKMDAGGAVVSSTDWTFAHFQFYPSTTDIAVYTDVGAFIITANGITTGEWQHLALVITSGGSTVYRNGVVVGSNNTAFSTVVPTDGLQIGRGYQSGRYFNGMVDEVRIWHTARTQAQIQADMYTELTMPQPFLVYYQMEDGQGTNPPVTTLTDITGNGRNGTLTNMDGDIDWAGHLWRSGGFTGSNGGLDITDISFLNDNGDHIDFAHDGGSGTTTADLPGADFEERWGRVWTCSVQDSGAVGGNIQLVFRSSASVIEPASRYRLLRRSGVSGSFADVQSADSVDTSADTITFNSVSATGLCSQITIGVLSNLDSPGAPADSASQMYTLEQIYDRLTTGAAATKMTTFTEPGSGPGADTMHTLNEIMAAAPEVSANGAIPADVFNSQTFWGLTSGAWGLQSGTLNLACNTATFDGSANLVANAYDSAGDGTDRWCMTNSGDAVAGDILQGKIAWIDGSAMTGSMAPQMVDNTTVSQAAGYYNAFNLSTIDPDLTSRNIRSGVSIYGVNGGLYGGCACDDGYIEGTRWCIETFGDGTFPDLHGRCLRWSDNANSGGLKPWHASNFDDAHSLASSRYGCRLPTENELFWLTHGSEPVLSGTPSPFSNVQPDYYWTSTTGNFLWEAIAVSLVDGSSASRDKTENHYVWPICD